MIRADALAVHLNFLQESVQPEGERRAAGCAAAICERRRHVGRAGHRQGDRRGHLAHDGAAAARSWRARAGRGRRGRHQLRGRRGAARRGAGGDARRAAGRGAARLGHSDAGVGGRLAGGWAAGDRHRRHSERVWTRPRRWRSARRWWAWRGRCCKQRSRATRRSRRGSSQFLSELRTVLFLTGSADLGALRGKPRVVTGATREWVEQLGY